MTDPADRPLTASDLYARSQSRRNSGSDDCYWCGSPCEKRVPHGDMPRDIGALRACARRPGNQYMCIGCQLWRRPAITAFTLTGNFRDRQTPRKLSWWITEDNAISVDRLTDGERLYEQLLRAPTPFCLMIRDGESVDNTIQLGIVNAGNVMADRELEFTVNNVRFTYSVYELEQAVKNGPEGKLSGIHELFRLFGSPAIPKVELSRAGYPKGGTHKGTSSSAGVRRVVTSG